MREKREKGISGDIIRIDSWPWKVEEEVVVVVEEEEEGKMWRILHFLDFEFGERIWVLPLGCDGNEWWKAQD